MSINYVKGDLFGPIKADSEPGAIVLPHVCNDRGAWGAGFVVPLGRTFPSAKQNYLAWHGNCLTKSGMNITGEFGLGETQFVNVDDKIFVANMVAQTLGGARPLFYNHLCRCMDSVAKFVMERSDAREHPARIICPAFGSGLAGGNWVLIEQLIQDCWLRLDISVSVYYLPGTLPDVESRIKTPTSSLKDACTVFFGGVGAMSPELYAETLESVAQLCGRTVDDQFRSEVTEILKQMPCPLD